MEYIAVVLLTIIVSSLTFLSGFGLGTLLLPVFIFFFPIDIAIASTAIVHLANNFFKAFLVGKKADVQVVYKFSAPAAVFAIIGALLLNQLGGVPTLYSYQIADHTFLVTPIKLVVAMTMLVFSIIEFLPATKNLAFDPKLIPLGGAVSGFFGGLTGHQGALRAAFLVRLNQDKETYIGTTIVSSLLIDVSRLLVYGATFFTKDFKTLLEQGQAGIIIAGIIAAFIGALLGYFFVKKVTLAFMHKVIGVLLVFYSIALASGLL
ncbi:MAG: sulfite exporter TauE/SafE family protein [Vampirovibrionales bacterium]|nr:sulfite exporter TauE/SafE family protein [Vampirovibrionales bacterium]